jgi:hypothetical protein
MVPNLATPNGLIGLANIVLAGLDPDVVHLALVVGGRGSR